MKFSVKKVAQRFGAAAFLFFLIKGLIWLAVFFGAAKLFWPAPQEPDLTVWEIRALDPDRESFHFHLVAPHAPTDTVKIKALGRQYLEQQNWTAFDLELAHCPACLPKEKEKEARQAVEEKGFAVYRSPGR